MLVYIYGTLKRNKSNHHILSSVDAKYICDVITIERYPMFILNQPFPYLQNDVGFGGNVIGELWEISESAVRELDRFEGSPDLYYRGKIDVENHEKVFLDVSVYFKTKKVVLETIKESQFMVEW